MSITIDHALNGRYSTTDTALAAWLYSLGFELTDVDTAEFPSVFFFRNDDPRLLEKVREYQVGQAEGNVANFYRSYKRLLAILKTGHVK